VFVPYFEEALPSTLHEARYFALIAKEGQGTLSAERRSVLIVPHVEARVIIDSNVLLSCCLGATVVGLLLVFAIPFQGMRTFTKCTVKMYDVTDASPIDSVDSQSRQTTRIYPIDGMTPFATVEAQSNSVSNFSPTDGGDRVVVPNHRITAQNLASRVAEAVYSAL
jgi:hypothetical protein